MAGIVWSQGGNFPPNSIGGPGVFSTVTATGAITSGAACTPAGATASGGLCMTEAASTGWTSTAGFDYIRADTTHALFCGMNGVGEPNCTFDALTAGVNGSLGGVVSFAGLTSGSATITAPAVAGTITNPFLMSNSLRLPTGTVLSFNGDAGVSRVGPGTLAFGNGAAGDTSARLSAAGFSATGTKFTTNGGCGETSGTTTGGATAGKYTTAGSTSCTSIITMGNNLTAPNGWSCTALDLTTVGDVTDPHQTASTTQTATIASGTIVAADVIQFSCIGY
jgi:hypothetical protein